MRLRKPDSENLVQTYFALAKDQGRAPSGSPQEPLLDTAEIQGNSLVGFNKEDRGRALTLIQAMSTPAGVTREGVLQLNERMLQLWKDKVY